MVGMYGSSRVRRRPSADEHLHARWLGSKLPLFARAPLSGNTPYGPPGMPLISCESTKEQACQAKGSGRLVRMERSPRISSAICETTGRSTGVQAMTTNRRPFSLTLQRFFH
jgi:hypothetical protein